MNWGSTNQSDVVAQVVGIMRAQREMEETEIPFGALVGLAEPELTTEILSAIVRSVVVVVPVVPVPATEVELASTAVPVPTPATVAVVVDVVDVGGVVAGVELPPPPPPQATRPKPNTAANAKDLIVSLCSMFVFLQKVKK